MVFWTIVNFVVHCERNIVVSFSSFLVFEVSSFELSSFDFQGFQFRVSSFEACNFSSFKLWLSSFKSPSFRVSTFKFSGFKLSSCKFWSFKVLKFQVSKFSNIKFLYVIPWSLRTVHFLKCQTLPTTAAINYRIMKTILLLIEQRKQHPLWSNKISGKLLLPRQYINRSYRRGIEVATVKTQFPVQNR